MADAVRDQGAGVGAAPPHARVDDGSSDDAPAAAKAPAAAAPTAVQIVSVSDDGNHFTLDEAALTGIIGKVPVDMKVSVLAVVGAFRTGKSFVLDIFLQYLQYCEDHPDYDFGTASEEPGQSAWMFSRETVGGATVGNNDSGFKWRSGHDRMTTGMWMWNKHFVVKRPGSDEKIALLVIDTQGLYDLQTSDQLTTSIFGLSTLISSYLVFNVSLQIQEDNMKSLALFSEYARVALHADKKQRQAAAADSLDAGELETKLATVDSDGDEGDETKAAEAPFQLVQFLVRDSRLRSRTLPDKLREMDEQVAKVMGADVNQDLRMTREQVRECFADVKGFYLPYPGEDVSESDTYDGDVHKIRPVFREMVEAYVRQLFCERLNVKRIHGREVTAGELRHFFIAYAQSFSEAAIFPKAESLLIATATANNRAFADVAQRKYTTAMDKVVGPKCQYIVNEKLKKAHALARAQALECYTHGATFGPEELKEMQREKLAASMKDAYDRYVELNKSRDPFKNLELYIFGLGVGLAAYVLRVMADSTCGGISEACDAASNLFSNIYIAFFSLLLLSIAMSWHSSLQRIQALLKVFGFPMVIKATKPKQD